MHKQEIFKIFNQNGILETAVCSFSSVKNMLLACGAAKRIPENAKSIIMAAFPYKVEDEKPKNISRYAAVPDYHIVCGEMLQKTAERLRAVFPNNKFEPFLDNSPIPEVYAGVHSGLGILGKNGLLIHKKYGSFVFLGEIITDLPLKEDSGGEKCLDCGQCSKACPVNLCKEFCLSAVNQQKKELNLTQTTQIKQSGCVWGCDICSEVCPHNKNAEKTNISEFISGYRNEYISGEDSACRAYTWRGENVIKRNYEIITGVNKEE